MEKYTSYTTPLTPKPTVTMKVFDTDTNKVIKDAFYISVVMSALEATFQALEANIKDPDQYKKSVDSYPQLIKDVIKATSINPECEFLESAEKSFKKAKEQFNPIFDKALNQTQLQRQTKPWREADFVIYMARNTIKGILGENYLIEDDCATSSAADQFIYKVAGKTWRFTVLADMDAEEVQTFYNIDGIQTPNLDHGAELITRGLALCSTIDWRERRNDSLVSMAENLPCISKAAGMIKTLISGDADSYIPPIIQCMYIYRSDEFDAAIYDKKALCIDALKAKIKATDLEIEDIYDIIMANVISTLGFD